jgi:hypothetical protein
MKKRLPELDLNLSIPLRETGRGLPQHKTGSALDELTRVSMLLEMEQSARRTSRTEPRLQPGLCVDFKPGLRSLGTRDPRKKCGKAA